MKSKCPDPIILRNGTVVPCGKCEICRANARLEWQYRLRIHLMSCDKMPMFVTLTYDNEHVPYLMSDGDILRDPPFPNVLERTVWRPDMSSFLKEYKRKYGLNQHDFQYFGCMEYGDLFSRPHGHLILFGDKDLYEIFMRDSALAQKRIHDVWKFGNVHVGLASYAGMAYVTKYVLKSNKEDYDGKKVKPFTVASNGLGMNYLKSINARKDIAKLHVLKHNFPEIVENMPSFDFYSRQSIKNALAYLRRYVPDFTVVLDDGTKVFVPRAIRKKMTGSFEHFKDNPLWLYFTLKNLLDSLDYYAVYGDYDASHRVSAAYEKSLMRIIKIRQNKSVVQYNKNLKKLLYETV